MASDAQQTNSKCQSAALRLIAECPPDYSTTSFSRNPELRKRIPFSHGTVYNKITDKTLTPGVPIGANMRAWPDTEINLYVIALVREFSRDDLRELTALLMEARQHAGLRSGAAPIKRLPSSSPQLVTERESDVMGAKDGTT